MALPQSEMSATEQGLRLDLSLAGVHRRSQHAEGLKQASPAAAAGAAGGLLELESPMAAYFGESCKNQPFASLKPPMATCFEHTSQCFADDALPEPTCVDEMRGRPFGEDSSSINSRPFVGMSPMDAYFDSPPSGSFCLDTSPQETPLSCVAAPSPMMAPVAPPRPPGAWSLPLQQNAWQGQAWLLQATWQAPNSYLPSKPTSFHRGAETTRAKVSEPSRVGAARAPQPAPLKRAVTVPTESDVGSLGKESFSVGAPDSKAVFRSSHASGPSVTGHVWSLSQDSQGCREVQDAIELANDEQARVRLSKELIGHVREALQCPHANHVLRKCINTMSAPSLQFIVDELAHEGPEAIGEAARHRYGCRIMEALLNTCAVEQMDCIVVHLLAEAAALSTHMYGNFVIQRLVENGSEDVRRCIIEVLKSNVAVIGANFYGAVVLGAALKHAVPEDQRCIALAILGVHGLLAAIMRFRHGRTIKEQLSEILGEAYHDFVDVQLQASPIKVPRNGQHCVDGKAPAQASQSARGNRGRARKGDVVNPK